MCRLLRSGHGSQGTIPTPTRSAGVGSARARQRRLVKKVIAHWPDEFQRHFLKDAARFRVCLLWPIVSGKHSTVSPFIKSG